MLVRQTEKYARMSNKKNLANNSSVFPLKTLMKLEQSAQSIMKTEGARLEHILLLNFKYTDFDFLWLFRKP